MYQAFMDAIATIRLYAGSGYLAALYLLALIYLLVTEKEKPIRMLLGYAPLTILVIFLCPPFRIFFDKVGLDGETYYRLLWLLPQGLTIAYVACRLFAAHRRIGLILMAAAIVLGGKYVYDSPNITKAENAYHIPSVTAHICEFLRETEELDYIRAVFPASLVHFVRQYDTDIMMPYGRDMLVARWDYYNAVYEAMEKSEVVQLEVLLTATRVAECNYIVLHTSRQLDGDPADYQLELLTTLDGFFIYRDPIMVNHIKEKYGPYL